MPNPLKTNVITSVPEPEEDTDLREDLEVDPPGDPNEDEPEEVPPPPQESDVERRARGLGWHPKDEYLGPPGKWVDAETFVKRGQDILPVLRDNNKRLLDRTEKQTGEIAELKRSLSEQSQVLKELREIARTSNERGYERARSELKSQQRDAVANGDTDRFDKVSQQIEEIEKTRAIVIPPTPTPTSTQSQVAPEIADFISRNSWFNSKPMLNKAMQGEHVRLRTENPDLSLEENLAEAKAAVVARFPEEFDEQEQGNKFFPKNGSGTVIQRRATVAQPSGRQQSTNNKRDMTKIESIDDPVDRAEAKNAYARFKRQMPDYTEAEYMKSWINPHGTDILADLRAKKEARRGK